MEHMDNSLVRQIISLYVSYRGRFVISDPLKGLYVPKHGEAFARLRNSHIYDHLSQRYAVCVFAGAFSSPFVCFDVDSGGKAAVRSVMAALEELGFAHEDIHISISGGKGYHVELFFEQLVYTSLLRRIYEEVLRRTGLNRHAVEFRPTHTQAIKLPLSVHNKTHRRCWYCDRDTLEPIEDPGYVFRIGRIPREKAEAIAYSCPEETIRPEPPAKPIPVGEAPTHSIAVTSDAYPMIQAKGERHALMVGIAVYNRYQGRPKATCRETLLGWYERQPAELIDSSRKAVLEDIDRIVSWVYSSRFVLGQAERRQAITFTPQDVRLLLAMRTRAQRRIMFLAMRGSKKYGKMEATLENIGLAVGVSPQAALTAIDAMVDARRLLKETGRKGKTSSGKYVAHANRYAPNYDTKLPADMEALRLDGATFSIPFDSADPMADYYGVLHAFCDMKTLQRFLKPKELNELKEAIENGAYTSATATETGDTARRELCA